MTAASSPLLFDPLALRSVRLRNRTAVSPMCQYSSDDGLATDWHLVHLGQFATGGAGLVMSEATAVLPEGRISPHDLGLWKDDQVPALRRVTSFVREHGAVPAVQLAHAGRKASSRRPWDGRGRVPAADGGWDPVAPSPIPFTPADPPPLELSASGIERVVLAFRDAAARSLAAGFQAIEIHAAHGYLIHEFLSPLSNHRTDEYGGSLENRSRLLRQIVQAAREVWPAELPLLVRLSATDWADGGWDLDQTVRLAQELRELGVDLIDCSSGGLTLAQQVVVSPGYQVPFAARVRHDAGILTAAVGLIEHPEQAQSILSDGHADLIMLGRALLRDPHWPHRAAKALGQTTEWPVQYERARD